MHITCSTEELKLLCLIHISPSGSWLISTNPAQGCTAQELRYFLQYHGEFGVGFTLDFPKRTSLVFVLIQRVKWPPLAFPRLESEGMPHINSDLSNLRCGFQLRYHYTKEN
jgi:hypothetical protein